MKQAIAVLLAALAMYVWGFAYWGFSPIPYSTWKQSNGDEAAQQALREHFPVAGTYYVPGMNHPPEELDRLMQAGPTGFVHITSWDGRPTMMPSVMVWGFVLCLAVAGLASLLLRLVAPALPSYGSRVKLIALVALLAVVMIHIGDVVWWMLPFPWKLSQAFYDWTALMLAGLVLARKKR